METALDDRIAVSTIVRNQRARAVDVVAQFYFRDVTASIAQPIRRLARFQKFTLAPGESKRVTFAITAKDLGFVGQDLRANSEPALFFAWISPSSTSGESVEFTLLGA